jgi:3-oxoacyl-[acyl-carrier-protein] synthase-3
MKYSRVFIEALGYELPPLVVTSAELEERLRPVFDALHIPPGQLEALTGIGERRWWEPGYPLADGAIAAARKALAGAAVPPMDIEVVVYGGVCREQFEPATACRVAAALEVGESAAVYDVGNACLGVLNGMVDVANRIELGQIRAGLVVSSESAREVVEATVDQLLKRPTMDHFRTSLATLTGGSGAVAVLLTDGSFGTPRRRLVGGVTQTAPQFHGLCRWGVVSDLSATLRHFASTDAAAILKHGVALGLRTWQAFLTRLGWLREQIDRIICHQVGALHRDTILTQLGIAADRDFPTFPYLGNMGTVSLPLSAALAEEREFLRPGDRVGFLGIASGLNCLMLGVEW